MASAASHVVNATDNGLPIPRLPAETTSAIFLYLSDVQRRDLYAARTVSKRWKEFIDGTPALWTHISTHLDPEVARHAIARSGTLPLDVDIGVYPLIGSHSPDSTIADAALDSGVLGELSRIRTLEISMELDLGVRHLLDGVLTDKTAPQLEELRVVSIETDDMVPVALDTDLLQGSVPPLLRVLEVSLCAISLRCSLLQATTLVDLRLENCRVWGTINAVFQSLSTWPLLETFVWTWPDESEDERNDTFIDGFAMPEMPTFEWKGERLPLPHLKMLKLRHEAAAILTVFSRLALPPSCDIALSVLVQTIVTEADEKCMRVALDHTLGAYVGNVFSDGEGFTTMTVETPRDDDAPTYMIFPGITVAWTLPSSPTAPQSLRAIFHRLENSPRCKELVLFDHMMRWPQMSSFLARVDLGPSDFLYEEFQALHEDRGSPDKTWKRMLVPMKSIRHLAIRKDAGVSWLFKTLRGDRSILPQMTSLYFEEVYVEELSELISIAKQRLNDYSLPPMHITLRKCTIEDGEEVPLLKIDMSP